MHSGPGDSDVEQSALLFDGFAVGAVRQRMRDGQRAVGKSDQEHRVPLQPLGGVQRGQRDALHHRWVARVGAQSAARPADRAGPAAGAAPPRRRPVRPARPAPPSDPGRGCPPAVAAVSPSGSSSRRTTSGRAPSSAVPRFSRALQCQQRLADLLATEKALAAANLIRRSRPRSTLPRRPRTAR